MIVAIVLPRAATTTTTGTPADARRVTTVIPAAVEMIMALLVAEDMKMTATEEVAVADIGMMTVTMVATAHLVPNAVTIVAVVDEM